MKAFVLAALATAAVLAAVPASADPTAPAAPPTVQVPEHTFYVRLDKPHVVWDPLESTCRHASLSIL